MNIITQEKSQNTKLDEQVRVLKAITHPARIEILRILEDGEHCVCHMEAYLGYRQAYISQQLSVLREAGLITDRRDGWNVYYRVTDNRIYDVLDALYQLTGMKKVQNNYSTQCTCPICTTRKEFHHDTEK